MLPHKKWETKESALYMMGLKTLLVEKNNCHLWSSHVMKVGIYTISLCVLIIHCANLIPSYNAS